MNYLSIFRFPEKHFEAHNKNNLDFIELNPLPFCLICFHIKEQFKEESYQTAPVFDLFSKESDHSTQTVIPESMINDSMQQNILIALQGIQTALERRNNTSLSLFRIDVQDPIEWLDDFERAATANQYDNEYKFQIVGGYLQGSPATWFSQETNANAQQRIIRWAPANAKEDNISFTTQFEIKFRTHMELERRTQGLEDNQRMHLEYTLSVFASALIMASALQMATISFAAQTPDPNEQLIDRLTANLVWLLKLLVQTVKENQQTQRTRFEPHFNQF
ncbi:hypothetical protein G9A89_012757 [Geosiphon pyriformis]|nr:hypothetical protein G9A89_012757 [Geosiphon pyriformis]